MPLHTRLHPDNLLSFDSSLNQYVVIADAPQLNFTGELTLSFLLMVTGATQKNNCVISKFVPNSPFYSAGTWATQGFGVYFSADGVLSFQYSNGTVHNEDTRLSTPVLGRNTLYHVICTADRLDTTIFLNGVVVARRRVPLNDGNFATPGQPLYLGRSSFDTFNYAPVALGRVALFNKRVSTAEAEHLFKTLEIPRTLHPYCKAYYPLNQVDGELLFDAAEQFNYAKNRGDELLVNTDFRYGIVSGDGWQTPLNPNWSVTTTPSIKGDATHYLSGSDSIQCNLPAFANGIPYLIGVTLRKLTLGVASIHLGTNGFQIFANGTVEQSLVLSGYQEIKIYVPDGQFTGEFSNFTLRKAGDYTQCHNTGQLMSFSARSLSTIPLGTNTIPDPTFSLGFANQNQGWHYLTGSVTMSSNQLFINTNDYFLVYTDISQVECGVYELLVDCSLVAPLDIIFDNTGNYSVVMLNGLNVYKIPVFNQTNYRVHLRGSASSGSIIRRVEMRLVRPITATAYLDISTKNASMWFFSVTTGNKIRPNLNAYGTLLDYPSGLPKLEYVFKNRPNRPNANQSGSTLHASSFLPNYNLGYTQHFVAAYSYPTTDTYQRLLQTGIQLQKSSTQVDIIYGTGNADEHYSVNFSNKPGELTAYTFTLDNAGKSMLYINGVYYPAINQGKPVTLPGTSLYFGEEFDTGICRDAQFAVLGIWERTLSQHEIAYLWNGGLLANPTKAMQQQAYAYFSFNTLLPNFGDGRVPNLLGACPDLIVSGTTSGGLVETDYRYLLAPLVDVLRSATVLCDEQGYYIVDEQGNKIIM